jgi:hypothetical protein
VFSLQSGFVIRFIRQNAFDVLHNSNAALDTPTASFVTWTTDSVRREIYNGCHLKALSGTDMKYGLTSRRHREVMSSGFVMRELYNSVNEIIWKCSP